MSSCGNCKKSIITTHAPEETRRLGRRLGEKARPGLVIALTGDLGVGKTVFAQGFAEGMGVKKVVSSPTFTILRQYEGEKLPLAHFDAYRLEDETEMEAIGGDEFLGADGVCLVEWPERIRGLLPPETVWISIRKEPSQGTDVRIITMEGDELHEASCY